MNSPRACSVSDAKPVFPAAAFFAAVALLSVPFSAGAADLQVEVVQAVADRYILPERQPPSTAAPELLEFTAAPGEYEPASFVLYARAASGPLRLSTAPLVSVAGTPMTDAKLDVRVVKRWYQSSFGPRADKQLRYLTPELLLYDDELVKVSGNDNLVRLTSGEYVTTSDPAMNRRRLVTSVEKLPIRDARELQPVTIAAGGNRQFWVTLHTPADAPPGLYRSRIDILSGAELVATLPVEVELVPIKLGAPALEVSIYYRGYLDKNRPEGSISSEAKSSAQYLADLRNMAAHGVQSPTIYQRYNTGRLREVLELWQQAGLPTRNLYYLGVTVVGNNDGVVPGSLTPQVKDSIRLADEFGFGQVYFYARDEAYGDGLTYQYPFWDAVRKAGGKVLAAGWQTSETRPGNFDVTGGKEDVFVCLGTVRAEEADRWHGQQRKIYSYQNPTGGNEIPETFRRNYGLLLWQKGFDGAMPYAYQDGEGRSWHDFDSYYNRDITFTYPTLDEPVDTVQWEGFREGVDDLRYLQVLLEQLAARRDAAALAARRWLADLKAMPTGRLDLDAARAAMVGYILALQNAETAAPTAAVTAQTLGPAGADGIAHLDVQLSQRAPLQLWLGDAGEPLELAATHYGWQTRHRLTIPAFASARTPAEYELRDFAGAVLTRGQLAPPDARKFAVADAAAVAGMAPGIRLELASDYVASVALDRARSLLGWWRFSSAEDGAVVDQSSWSRAAELKGDAVIAEGVYGSGVRLSGAGDIVAVGDIDVPENGTATVEGWFKFDTFAMDINTNIGVFSGLYQHAANNHLYIAKTNDHFFAAELIERGVWHHLALTWDGDVTTAMLYVDGRPVPITVAGGIEEMPAVSGLSIGRSSSYLGRFLGGAKGTFAGGVDEVRVWDRALSAAEVAAAWRAGRRESLIVDRPASVDESLILRGANAADQDFAVPVKLSRQVIGD